MVRRNAGGKNKKPQEAGSPVSQLRFHQFPLKQGINKTAEFLKKGLAAYAVNVGLKCSHRCTYCSSGSLLRCHDGFKVVKENPFQDGYCIVDPDIPQKVAKDAARHRKRGMIQLCTTVDAWCPGAQQYDLGRRCLEAILAEPGWTIRILTKNAAVMRDFDLIEKHRDRVLVGVSLTGTVAAERALAVVEPLASPISERMEVMRRAHELGLRVYGMLCPLLPGIADSPEQLDELVTFAQSCGAEEFFAEPVNGRGPGLCRTAEALSQAGFLPEAEAVNRIRKRTEWSAYTYRLIGNLQSVMRRRGLLDQLRFLLYSSRLLPEHEQAIRANDAGVVWL